MGELFKSGFMVNLLLIVCFVMLAFTIIEPPFSTKICWHYITGLSICSRYPNIYDQPNS